MFLFGGNSFGVGARILLCLTPLAWTLHHYGGIVAVMVQTASSRVSRLQSLAATDGLTGLINRRQFNHRLDTEIARARRYRNPLSLALFDIDDFKKINDLYGHPIGDRILGELGRLIIANVRESDIPARYGGEEFALILPETLRMDAYELLERLRSLIEGTVFCLPDNPMTVTVSVGVTQMEGDRPQAYELIEAADAALYDAKKQGKNRVIPQRHPMPAVS
jgi:diguanylate cyclase (GGDEF)-like protein